MSIVVEAMKFAMLRSRRSLAQNRLERRKEELAAALKRVEEKEKEADLLQDRLGHLIDERQKTLALIKQAAADRIEMVHELGMIDQSQSAFTAPLTVTADINRIEERRVMFHREIWKRRNTALVWADNLEAATAALSRVFNTRSAVQFAKVAPHPELSRIPGSDPR